MLADAVAVWSAELARAPRSLAFLSLGDELRRRRQLEDALQVALRGLERHPYLADAHDLLARVYVDLGEDGKARDEWEMALQLEPEHLASLKGLGFLAFRRRDLAAADRHLRAAVARDPRDAGLQTALQRVQTALQAAPAGAPASAPPENGPAGLTAGPAGGSPAEHARTLFAPLLGDGDRTALLIDRDGLVLAGACVDPDGRDIAGEVGAELSGIGDEATRALTHLGLGAWQVILVEAQHATVALAPVHESATVLVAAARDTQVGFARRLVERARGRAAAWLESLS